MVIHPGKSRIIILSKTKFIGPMQNIKLENVTLEVVENHKILGVHVDEKLSWNSHIDITAIKKRFQC